MSVTAAASPTAATRLFARYRRWTSATLAGVLAVTAGLMVLEINSEYESELLDEAETLLGHANALAGVFASGADHVVALQQAAATHFDQYAAPRQPPSRRLARLLEDERDGRWALDRVPEPYDETVIGNITGIARPMEPDLLRELDMAIAMNPLLRAASQAVADSAWVYYVSDREFINLFPWRPSSAFRYTEEMREMEFFTAGLPKANPERSVRWTSPYLDQAGKGLMITATAPVYDGDRFRGVVCLDLTLARLNRLVAAMPTPYGSAFIVNDRGQLLAHRTLVRPDATEPRPLADAFPADLRGDAMELVRRASEPVSMIDVGAWRVDAEPIAGTPFTLVVVVTEATMLREVMTRTPFTMLAMLAGLGALLAVANVATRREFIAPSERLVGFIEAESRGQAAGIPPVPAAWRPWFDTVHSVFNAHAQLVAIRQELDVARRMQQAILPTRFPDRPDVQLYARMEPARQVGGDFYDFFWLDDRRLGVIVADVSDKGVPAALFMAVSRTLLRAVAADADGPAAALAAANDLLSQDNDQAMFVTVFYGVLDLATGRLVYANGGHNPPILVAPDGTAAFLTAGRGTALGVMEGLPYAEGEAILAPGAALLCYTDGVTDAIDPSGALFGEERLVAVASVLPEARGLVEALTQAVDAFAAGTAQADDITALAVRWSGLPPSRA